MPEAPVISHFYYFADFVVDAEKRRLLRLKESISLTPKVFDTLLILVERAGETVEKDELMKVLWADSFVEEANIPQNVAVLRKALGDSKKNPDYILTVPGKGYRFIAKVTTAEDGRIPEPELLRPVPNDLDSPVRPTFDPANFEDSGREAGISSDSNGASISKRWLVAAMVSFAAILLTIFAVRNYDPGNDEQAGKTLSISSLAVLPLKPFDPGDNYVGLGISDAIIRRISQTGMITVRPTSAVRRYLSEETDALTAARTLGVDTILEGTIQREGERFRVSVNLLRTADSRSLWADTFDMRTSDIFAIQDKVAQEVAESLRLRLDPAQQQMFARRNTSNTLAYEYYLKGIYSFDQRWFSIENKPQMEATINLLKKSVDADPDFALARADLGYAYAWMGIYIDAAGQENWIELAKQEIARADALDPTLAETHIARHHVLLSAHEGYQLKAAIHEALKARQLDPNIGAADLAADYLHLGLEDLFEREMKRSLELDPTSEFNRNLVGVLYGNAKLFDEWLDYRQKYFDGEPDIPYLLGKGRLDEAQKKIDLIAEPDRGKDFLAYSALLAAKRGDHKKALSYIPALTRGFPNKYRGYHHAIYDVATIYALCGDADSALRWLRETANSGFPEYQLFLRDAELDPIRKNPKFVQFMEEMRIANDAARNEFEN